MICKQCGVENSSSARFCKECGARLEIPVPEPKPAAAHNFCPQCGTDNSPVAGFCVNCGARLAAPESQPQPQMQQHPQPRAASAGEKIGQAKESIGPKITDLLKMTFTSPIEYIEKAKKEEDCWIATVFMYLVCALVTSIIFALFMSRFASYINNGSLGVKAFFMLFLALVVTAGLCVLCLYGTERIFGSGVSLMKVVSGQGPAFTIAGFGMILIILLFVLLSSNPDSQGTVTFVIAIVLLETAWVQILLWKGHEITAELDGAKAVYCMLAYFVVFSIVMAIVYYIVGQSILSMTGLGGYYY